MLTGMCVMAVLPFSTLGTSQHQNQPARVVGSARLVTYTGEGERQLPRQMSFLGIRHGNNYVPSPVVNARTQSWHTAPFTGPGLSNVLAMLASFEAAFD